MPEVPPPPELPEPPDVKFERPTLPSAGVPGSMRGVRTMSLAFSAGISLITPIVIGALGGNWLDQRFGTSPWLTLILLLIGIIAGFTQLVRIMQRIEREEDKR